MVNQSVSRQADTLNATYLIRPIHLFLDINSMIEDVVVYGTFNGLTVQAIQASLCNAVCLKCCNNPDVLQIVVISTMILSLSSSSHASSSSCSAVVCNINYGLYETGSTYGQR